MSLRNRFSYTRKRRGAPTWLEGQATPGAAEPDAVFKGTDIQPLPGKEAKLLPEGERLSDYGVLRTHNLSVDLRTADQDTETPADDVVDANGGVWKVMKVAVWRHLPRTSHIEAVVKRVKEA